MLKESETIELKKSLSQMKEGVISLSSMLNKAHNGTVYFGVNDDGRVFGMDIGKKTIADITHEIRNNLKPLPVNVKIEPEVIGERNIIKVTVEGDDVPYAAYGRYYIRINDADIVMDSIQLQHFFEQKVTNYSKWENKETIYGIDDINEDLLIECIRSANENGRLNYVYKNAFDALNKLGLLTENGNLNNAGLYLFGNNKPLTIKEANFPTDTRTEFGEIKEYRGNIIECIRESMSYIQNHITYKSELVGLERIEKPEIPLRALREIIVNSFAHCSYGVQDDYNQYIIYKSSVRIYNPGGIIKDIDPIRFASGDVGSKIRNVLIASTLFKFGYIDSFGTGFDRTFTLCYKEGVDFSYHNDDFGFTFIFNRKVDILDGKKIDGLKSVDVEIIKLIRSNKYITGLELSNKLSKSEATIQRHLTYLVKNGYIARVGSRKNGYWELL